MRTRERANHRTAVGQPEHVRGAHCWMYGSWSGNAWSAVEIEFGGIGHHCYILCRIRP